MSEWKPISECPYQKVVWVRNELIGYPVKATRGYVHNGMVHSDQDCFTSVYTPDPLGRLVRPTEWKELEDV